MMRFDREQLETLAAVIDAGTFDAAAARLRVTPSAVSQRIKAFERELGRVLVVRSKPVRATASGEALVRLARQLALLERDALGSLGIEAEPQDAAAGPPARVAIPIAVNADSMASWILPAFARAAERLPIVVDLHREDQDHTAALLGSGTVMAAVTSQSHAVPGCTVTRLGSMRYRPAAQRAFAARWFPDGVSADALAVAPLVDFDRADELQSRYLRSVSRRSLQPPRHYVPASADFADAIGIGLGWGMLPESQLEARPDVVDLAPGDGIDVPLYWQQWNLRSPLLDAVAAEVLAEARRSLSVRRAPISG
jgi:LysR family transcriptional regulator (chromosome initiation inhibitor)